MFDSRAFRNAVGCFTTGVCVVTCRGARGSPVGVTVNSFTSVSLDPPLVLFSLDRASTSFPDFAVARHFAINVLCHDQIDLSRRFATTAEDKFGELDFAVWETGSPIFPRCLASMECDMHTMHDGGDHVIFVGRVRRLLAGEGEPLLYFRGRYSRLQGF